MVSELKYTMAAQGQALRDNTDRIRGGKIYNRSLEANTKGEGHNHCTYDSIAQGTLSQGKTDKFHLFLAHENIFAIYKLSYLLAALT